MPLRRSRLSYVKSIVRKTIRLVVMLILTWLTVFSLGVSADPAAARQLLTELAKALNSLPFEGKLTFENGLRNDAFHITHRVFDDKISETLTRLSGREQEFVQTRSDCGTLGGLLLSGLNLSSPDGRYIGLDRYYLPAVVGKERIAGRMAWVVQLMPADDHRFGISYAIDTATNLLLRYIVFDAQKGVVLERLQFVSLDISDSRSKANNTDTVNAIQLDASRCVGNNYNAKSDSPWLATWLPPGFILSRYTYDKDDGHIETYTDGVASFSVFVKNERVSNDLLGVQASHSATNRGATMALMTSRPRGKSMLTVNIVGEVPLSVAQKVSLSLRRKSPSPSVSPLPRSDGPDAN